ncbi:DUF433 domain-containing protein [Leptospira bandrabouensis]|uniref:DUF433 domain-containing protein n=1 Tax=Leptospira bandrabouensis TaxID=2484903 RepID=UPI00223C9E80|nr:DUF433 domain-containing protein [Leptospira bandrabouensis]MCW7460410.1 DUF433 domain-containing protein [Leptospira bandrabouensis]MCW7479433.1 DUF433 domain-containing protein [Leptospira bandrabouensis]MCW7487120.1 DUF433 domain-containing protein [Leptospira bandrabouensis]
MDYKARLTSSPEVLLGKPVIKNTRIAVDFILDRLGEGMSIEHILEAYPSIEKEDILACISYSSDVISRESLLAS